MERLYLDDLAAGWEAELGSKTLTQEEIVAFAREFDPQPFHVDEAAARASVYGGIIASGWHTAAICMRLVVDGFVNQTVSLGSPGLDELRWLKPVRPGDTLGVRVKILDVTPSRSKPDRGSAHFSYEVFNQRREVVMTMKGIGMFGRRTK
jgi:acyl dehydratase